MDFYKLLEILRRPAIDKETADYFIIHYLATQKDAIPKVLAILEEERKHKDNVIAGLNLNLSRTTLCLIDNKKVQKNFVLEETKKFYSDEKTDIRTCFIIWPDEQDGYANFKEKTEGNSIYSN